MGKVLQARSSARDDSTQHPLPLYERQAPQVSTVEPEAVEGDEARLSAAVEERAEERTPVSIQTNHLAVEDGVAYAPERDRDLGGERGEALERVAVAGDEAAPTAFDVGERPEPVELQLEEPVAVVEGIAASL